MTRPKWLLGAGVILLGVAIAVPFFPVARFVPALEAAATEKLARPVTIGALQIQLLPTPRVVAREVRVGAPSEVTLGELEIVPDLLSFIAGPRTIRLIRAERVALQSTALALAPGGAREGGTSQIVVRRIALREVRLSHPTLALPPFDAELLLSESMRVEEARLVSEDGGVKLAALAQAQGFAVSFDARDWTLPAGPPLLFQTLAARGTLRDGRLELERIDGTLYGGKAAGSARVQWTKDMELAGWTQLAGVDLVPLQRAFDKPAKLTGRLQGDAAFSARAASAAALRDALVLKGSFEIVGGAYQGVDLAKAGEIGGARGAGDATAFDELRGLVESRGARLRLEQLCLRSKSMVAGGRVEVAPDKTLSGRLDVSVAKTGGFVGVPLALGGTTAEPSITPTRGYLIGAAIGTALLPVIGTTIGSSIGGRFDAVAACK